MNKDNNSVESWVQDSYETGSTQPPKSRGGLVAVLLVLVILLCGATSYLGVLNIRLGKQLQQFDDAKVPIQFLPPNTTDTDPGEDTDSCVLPGVEGRPVSGPEKAFYRWPAGIVVTKVQPGSAAAEAGLTVGDILVGINDQAVIDVASLTAILQDLQSGSTVAVTFYRDDGSSHSFQCTLE